MECTLHQQDLGIDCPIGSLQIFAKMRGVGEAYADIQMRVGASFAYA